jgi:hypothetical protein
MGVISPEQAVAAIESGTADAVVRSIVLDETRAGRIIQRIREGPDSLYSMPEIPTGRMEKIPQQQPVIDPMTGQPQIDEFGMPVTQTVEVETGNAEMAPGWMPRHSDNIPAFKATFEGWMKTEEYERLDPEMQKATAEIYAGILQLESQKSQEAAMAQQAQAEGLGMANAAKAPTKPLASMPAVNGSQAQT